MNKMSQMSLIIINNKKKTKGLKTIIMKQRILLEIYTMFSRVQLNFFQDHCSGQQTYRRLTITIKVTSIISPPMEALPMVKSNSKLITIS